MKLFAILIVVILALAAAVNGASLGKSCICARMYSPVCGSDGVTYASDCAFNCAARESRNTAGVELSIVKDDAC